MDGYHEGDGSRPGILFNMRYKIQSQYNASEVSFMYRVGLGV